jgi:RHS repeat-associated protein
MGCLKLTYHPEILHLVKETAIEKSDHVNFLPLGEKNAGKENCDNYYPFGLTFNSYSRENSTENKYLYNQGTGEKTFKTERVYDLGLNVDQSKYRTYDYLTGRWWQVDPKADQGGQESWSTYQFGFNNPIRNNDPEGDIVFAIPLVYYAVAAVGAAVIAWQAKRTIDAAVSDYKKSNSNSTSSTKADPTTPNSKVLPAPGPGATPSTETGKIYLTPGERTKSGLPYAGRTTQETVEKRGQNARDGRVRKNEDQVDTYDPNNPGEGAYKEQKVLDDAGGVENTDNKRREVSKERMKELEKKYGPKPQSAKTNDEGGN